MRFKTLAEWLHWQEQLHPNIIDLGLNRVRCVLDAMALTQPPFRVLTVGGTNGKGSCVAFLDAMLRANGYLVGAYISPHLLRYNERVLVSGTEISDAELCAAFARVDAARGEVSLTYFEFGTLAALDIFRQRQVQVAVLEVGLGGRLDAVNAVDAEAALVASIGLDHQEWLGHDRDSIGYEKAGIYRAYRPAICGDRQPPARLLQSARQLPAELRVLGRDFDWQTAAGGWSWSGPEGELADLPVPALPGAIQFDNAASVIALLQAVRPAVPVDDAAIRAGLMAARIRARFEHLPGGDVGCIVDVAHNPAAAQVLARNLAAAPACARTLAVLGMFRDKAAEEVVRAVAPQINRWFLGGLEGPRGQTAAELARRIRSAVGEGQMEAHGTVVEAYEAARGVARTGDRIVVFGSFQAVSAVLRHRQESGTN